MPTLNERVRVSGGWRKVAAALGVALLAGVAAYLSWPRTATVVVSGCTPTKDVPCTAVVTGTPEDAVTIALLVVAVYLVVIAASGVIPTLTIAGNSITTDAPTARESSEKEAKGVDPVAPQPEPDAALRNLLNRPDEDLLSLRLYQALPPDVRTVAEGLWAEWGYGLPLALSIRQVRHEKGQGNYPWFIESDTPDGLRVIRATKGGRGKKTVTLTESE
jgi:hypothetical protein